MGETRRIQRGGSTKDSIRVGGSMTEEERKKYYKVITQNWLAFNEFLKNGDYSDTVQDEISEVIDKIYYENGKTEFAKNIALAVLNEIERLCKVKGSK